MEMEQQNVINGNGVENGNVSEEDMFVDDLIDFSKAEEYGVCDEEETVPFHLESISNTDSAPLPLHDAGLCLPADEQANLEWLSNFIDDSIHGYSLTIPVDNIRVKPDPKPSLKDNCTGTFSVQTKARSKRVRNSGRVWSLNDSASPSSSSSSCCPPNQLVVYNDVSKSAEKKWVKKQKLEKQDGGEPRRCSHCLVQKTPQWRAGPLGAKTLCNACGVRYKSGRLLPEYRPAISPTFSSEKHSNNHRKVMEMRRKKGDGGFVMPVESF